MPIQNRRVKTQTKDARTIIKSCAGINCRAAARRITQFFEDRLQTTGLSLAQFSLMIFIAAADNDTIGGLAERSGHDQSTLSRNLRGLERAGLVEIVTAERDLRSRAVWLTERGARRLEAAIPAWRDAQRALAREVDPSVLRRVASATLALVPR